MKETHTDKGLVMIILGFCILNLSLGIYANYRIFKLNRAAKEEKKETKEIVEKEVVDKDIQELFAERIRELEYTADGSYSTIYVKEIKSSEITSLDKARIAMIFMDKSSFKIGSKEEFPNTYYYYYEGSENALEDTEYKHISYEDFAAYYKNHWGEKLKNKKTLEGCPVFYFDEETNNYFPIPQYECGEDGNVSTFDIIGYNYKITVKGNTYKVYRRIAYAPSHEYNIYKDIDNKIKLTNYEEVEDTFDIDKADAYYENNIKDLENNKYDFDSYIITFERDNNNYYFKDIKKI